MNEPGWREIAAPPGEVRGLGAHDGALAALTSDGLFAWSDEAWRPLDAAALGASALPSGRLVIRRVSAPMTPTPSPTPSPSPSAGDVVELTALAVAPDGAVWTGVRSRGLSFYPAPGAGGAPIMHAAYPVAERLARDGVVVRDGLPARDLAFDARGRLWVATATSLDVLEDGAWRTALARAATQVAVAADGTIVVGTPTAGFRSADGHTWKTVPPRALEQGDWGALDLDAENVQQIERAPDGTLWARTRDGVLAWTGDRWASRNLGLRVIPRQGGRHLTTRALAIAGDAVHVATTVGVFRRDCR